MYEVGLVKHVKPKYQLFDIIIVSCGQDHSAPCERGLEVLSPIDSFMKELTDFINRVLVQVKVNCYFFDLEIPVWAHDCKKDKKKTGTLHI